MTLRPAIPVLIAGLLPSCNMTAPPSEVNSLLPAELPYELGLRLYFRYQLLPEDDTQKLRRACRDCAAVEFDIPTPMTSSFTSEQGKLVKIQASAPGVTLRVSRSTRGHELDSLLTTLQDIPHWYERRTPGVCINHAHSPSVRFLDAAGKELFTVTFWPEGGVCAKLGWRYVSLWEIFRRHLPLNYNAS